MAVSEIIKETTFQFNSDILKDIIKNHPPLSGEPSNCVRGVSTDLKGWLEVFLPNLT